MQTKITNVADIINGYTFRGAIETIKNSDVFVLQAKDIIQGQNISDTNKLTPIAFKGVRTASFLQKNDVVVVSRGTGAGSFRSVVFNSNENVIASSSLLILRIKKKEILPEYVSLYLNSSYGQNKILETVVGSYIHAISRKKFEEEIKIPIPSLEKQESLVKLIKISNSKKKFTKEKNNSNKKSLMQLLKI